MVQEWIRQGQGTTDSLESGEDSRAFNRTDLSGVELVVHPCIHSTGALVGCQVPTQARRQPALDLASTQPPACRRTSHKTVTQEGEGLGVVGGIGGDWSAPTSRTAEANQQQPKHHHP